MESGYITEEDLWGDLAMLSFQNVGNAVVLGGLDALVIVEDSL